MRKDKPTVMLLYGGAGCEANVSKTGALYLRTLIDESEFNLIPVFISTGGEWSIKEPSDRYSARDHKPVIPICKGGVGGIVSEGGFIGIDAAFPLLHGDLGEDGVIQGTLRAFNIPYVGADTYTGPVAMDKAYTKIIAESLGIRTAAFVLGIRGTAEYSKERTRRIAEEKFGYPMFIKPARLGSSVGAFSVSCPEEFDSAYDTADRLSDGRVLIEELLDISVEAECAVFKVKNKEIITDFGGISCNYGFYDYDKKYSEGSDATVSESISIDPVIRNIMHRSASLLSDYLGIRHLGRFDFFITRDKDVIFNEINTMPGFTSGSLYPRLLTRSGIDPHDAVRAMLWDAIDG